MDSIKSAQLNGTLNQYEIPATMRQDGSWRKARKVKPGFVPQEEVPKYTPKGKRVAQNSPYPPGWHPSEPVVIKSKVDKPKPKLPADKPTGDKMKIKEKKDVAKVDAVKELSEKLQDVSLTTADPTVEISKKLKRLRKRLRESELLDEKIKAGEVTNSDQLEKSARRREFEEEIEQLEAERLTLRQLKPSKTT